MNKGKYNFAFIIFGVMMGFALVASVEAAEYQEMEWDDSVLADYLLLEKETEAFRSELFVLITENTNLNAPSQVGLKKVINSLMERARHLGQMEGVTTMAAIADEQFDCVEKSSTIEDGPGDTNFRPAVYAP